MIRLSNIKIYDNKSIGDVFNIALKKYKINGNDVKSYKLVKKAIDARDKKNICFVYSFDVDVKNDNKYKVLGIDNSYHLEINRNRKSTIRPVIVGAGPAGLSCALMLIEYGYKPIIIEQGSCVEKREEYVNLYRNKGIINEICNVQFGEGGAGTFSDGKLTTGLNTPLLKIVLDYFYKFGAPEDILYNSKPHIGTDNLLKIIKNIRKYIEEKGGTYYFDTKLESIEHDNLWKLVCNNQIFFTDCVVLAIGHSSRDTFRMLYDKGFDMKAKNFSVGVRIEHSQEKINLAQYGKTKLELPPAEYKLAYHGKNRDCYTFCMCPGGEVIASSSEKGSIVTNGMSYYKRDGKNSNSALLVNVTPEDFKTNNPLAGIEFQQELEKKAYILGGSNNCAPVQRLEDFMNNSKSIRIGNVIPSYKPGYSLSNLNDILPKFVSSTIKEAIPYFNKKIDGFADPDAILTGVETRSSSPITIIRNDNLESSKEGIYPCGEGAGYAGGISSSCVDGIKVAIKIIEKM